jgi:hypothetical protein
MLFLFYIETRLLSRFQKIKDCLCEWKMDHIHDQMLIFEDDYPDYI